MTTKRNVYEKYVWTDVEFEKWIKEQQRNWREHGLPISTAGVTRKLLKEVLIPNKIIIKFPKMEFKPRRGRR